ncbi:unnamed protein product [Cylindrotheca closterium]|uniref:Uncharacterized protein n=1 Tax=Cylindrotheca closterium TaxID=2856 RepID=A0AAD2CPH8_9STRA|nr:unnamed protein product [Cylindrotheca closterium]
MIRTRKRSSQKDRTTADTVKNVALILMIALNIFDRNSDFLSNFHRQLSEANGEVVVADQTSASSKQQQNSIYLPSRLENRIMERSQSELQYDQLRADECDLFHNKSRSDFYQEYHDYLKTLDDYTEAVKTYDVNLGDVRLVPREKRHSICQSMDDLLKGSFQVDTVLSKTREGFVEPLLPPLRHPRFCEAVDDVYKSKYVMKLDYLIHDFGAMCRQLSTSSKTVFIDLGASLDIHPEENPSLQLLELYQKFGIKFDHYYAFEATVIPPDQVYQKVPKKILPSFHWFNVPVEVNETSNQNPWNAVLSQYTEDDLVVVKLDIDTASVEIPLVDQLVEEKNVRIVDQFYFEHHVRMKHMLKFWRITARGTLQHSLDLFTKLRKAGIAAHSWV